MQYMLLIYSNPADRPKPGTPELGALMQGYADLGRALRADGAYVLGDALTGVDTARTLRGKGTGTEVMDGPFAETREHLGGFYIIEVPDFAAAAAYAARIPTVHHGAVEIRPLAGFNL